MKNEKGFTLLEMMIVLLVISVLLLVTIPNVTKHNSTINDKGCEALKKMVEAQIQAYEIDHSEKPASIAMLTSEYLDEGQTSCPNGDVIVINEAGEVDSVSVEEAPAQPSGEEANGL
ncbi:competence type IV pilus major pilin ComGC [Bacillus dakarensis]|uniref:competence type IV pilus major pilin ComGC n=1 Tax=Robertmurraya dakarensis TaxID=1926278 RepID=UPI0009817717|nr:competence type IV pilus major pilin ComGC [Bacillus dakarensis]